MKVFLIMLLAIPLVLTATEYVSEDEAIDPKLGIPLFLKVITYDDNFEADQYDGVSVYVVYDRSRSDSYEQMVSCRDFFQANPMLTVSNLPITLKTIKLSELPEAMKSVSAKSYNTILITAIDDKKIASVVSRCRAKHIRTFSFLCRHISSGVAVSIKPSKKKNQIMVNLPASRAEGSALSARLLKMCEIYQGAS